MRLKASFVVLVAALGAAGCGDDDGAIGPDGSVPDGGTPPDGMVPVRDTGPDVGPITDAEYGLDERPSNIDCVAPERPPAGDIDIRLERVFTGTDETGDDPSVTRPLAMLQAPGDAEHWYIVEKPGRVRRFTGDGSDMEIVVDVTGPVNENYDEAGLLGMAFHPRFQENGEVFLSFTANPRNRDSLLLSRIVRYHSSDGGATFDNNVGDTVFEADQFEWNHNGGWIGFGPDDYLYAAFGDGGGGGDPENNGQDTNTPLATVLRLNIDVPAEEGYGIPSDNPFVDGGGLPEIWAYGLRNPWRMSFDRATGTLWAGDVGQGALEEVDIIERGGNYGWDIREGDQCYNARTCQTAGLIDPVAVYGRDEGRSITGGYVYRGTAIPELIGAYLFVDHLSGRMWALRHNASTGEYDRELILETGELIPSFAEGHDGELYVMGLISGNFYKIVPDGDGEPAPDLPALLSETGCMDPSDPTQPGPGLIPYDVRAPLWSDGAAKRRWMAIPDGETITVNEAGDFEFPIGTVLVKSFLVDGVHVETRLFMRHPDGGWGGYTYKWNEAQTDATLLVADERVEVGDRTWLIPSRAQCMTCHSEVAGRSLGLEIGQLNDAFVYPGAVRANQLATLDHIGMFADALGDPASMVAFPRYDDDAPDAERARAYLHSNCSNCHRPEGPGRGDLDLRFGTAIADTGVCDAEPSHGDLGVSGARLVAPGSPEQSVLLLRMGMNGANRMPPLATEIIDSTGLALMQGWIEGLSNCE